LPPTFRSNRMKDNRPTATTSARTEHPARVPLVAVLTVIAALAAMTVIVLTVDPLRAAVDAALHGDTAGVRSSIHGLGVAGPLIVLGICLIHAVLFYPAEIVDAATGFVYGFGPGLALVMTGWMLSAWAAYAIGRSVAHPLLYRLFGAQRFGRAEAMVARGGVTLLLTLRLIPILPFSLICYAAGAARVPTWRYAWTTFVGYLPITVLATYLGSRLEHLHPTDPVVIGSVLFVTALLFAVRWLSRALQAEGPAS
jgi:uncharacterized membrane protein YdjX (TVP38/TMEM64 family)